MLKSVFVTNHHGERYELPLSNPDASGFLIKNISGMGPIKTSINSSSGALSPGEFFNSSKIEKRNIVIDLIYYPDSGMIEDQRLLAYKIFEVNTPIDIEFYTDRGHVIAHGYVESHEPVIFSNQCETSVSILCLDPFLYALGETVFSMSDLVKNFHFTFFNPDPPGQTKTINNAYYDTAYFNTSTTVPKETLIMGYYDTNSVKTLHNKGNASGIGMEIHVHVKGETLTNFIFGNQTRSEYIKLDDAVLETSVNGLQLNDEVIISSIRGKKSINIMRNNQLISILPAKVFNSDWVYLDSGDNKVYYSCDEGNATADVEVRYTAGYLGV